MRTARILSGTALAVVAATAVAGGAWADGAVNPFQTRPQQIDPVPVPEQQLEFQEYSQLFAWAVGDRGVGRWFDESLGRRIQADSRIDRVRDRSPEPIDVVRLDLRNPDGTSRVRSENGDFPFYVLRETPHGLVLMGKMFGSAYTSYIRDQHLEFRVEQHPSASKTAKMRFRVEGNVLVNLSVPEPKLPSADHGIARRER